MYNLLNFTCRICGEPKIMFYEDFEIHLKAEHEAQIAGGDLLTCWDCAHPPTPDELTPAEAERSAYDEYDAHIKNLKPAQFDAAEEYPSVGTFPPGVLTGVSVLSWRAPDGNQVVALKPALERIIEQAKAPDLKWEIAPRTDICPDCDMTMRFSWRPYQGSGLRVVAAAGHFRAEADRLLVRRGEMIQDIAGRIFDTVKRPSRKIFHNIQRRVSRFIAHYEVDQSFIDKYWATREIIPAELWDIS